MLERGDGRGKAFHLLIVAPQRVEHEPQGRLAPYAGQFGKFAHRFFEQGRGILLFQKFCFYCSAIDRLYHIRNHTQAVTSAAAPSP